MANNTIALQGQSANLMLPSEAMSRAQSVKEQRVRNAMLQRDMDAESALDAAYQQAGGDINALTADPRMGFKAGMQIESIKSQQAQGRAAAEKAQRENLIQQLEYGSQILGGASDQNTWNMARSQFAEIFGPEAASRLPEQYDPATQQTLMQQGLTMRDKIAMQREERMAQAQMASIARQDRMADIAERRLAAAEGRGDSVDTNKGWEVDLKSGQRINKYTGEVAPLTMNGQPYVPQKGAGAGMDKETFNFANTLRDEYNQQTKEFVEVQTQVERLKQFADNPSAAGDQAIIFAAMKANDPTSTVRESEFALAATAGGYGERIQSAMTKIQNGEMLTPEQRKDFLQTAKRGYDVQKKNYAAVKSNYEGLAKQSGIDPTLVVSEKARDVFQENNTGGLSGRDAEAAAWAQANPNDPRAAAIRQRLGL